ncbi:hypothetical protein ALI22I_24645 [Saccharothrix sp. ALI-22-I]|uniref:FAD/NAD(P)-binding protein n=1 Tax=Saccharothrix sp. ALI-22-I TaxID=1933778 RepID=UPI00097C02F1|nr:FAD/NAD(P)-binding domain-containing protein [Saccharothrix sp. ALI-22-I]ONI86790.1 hypothetical protein ALI22I_24645 [Saccharothrix sp. ALI-22-I]
MTVVCIVGAGPRGTSVLERICANAREPVRVHVVDPFPPGPGRVWRTDQPEHLLMNTPAGQVSLFTDATVPCTGPHVPGPSLAEWAGVDPDGYPSRAQYGRYLTWVFQRLTRQVDLVVHRAEAVALDDTGVTQSVTLSTGHRITADAVVLALGHDPVTPSWTGGHLSPGNAADADLSALRPGDPVLLRGMGLTFFDYLSLCTVGRGGRFTRADGTLRYLPSGREPQLFATSRRGVPHHARGVNQKGTAGRHEPVFLTHDRIAALPRGRSSFRRDIWPLVDREVRHVYHRAHPSGPPWNWRRIANPARGLRFPSRGGYQNWLIGHLVRDVAHAERGNVRGPVKAALDVLRDIRNEIRLAVDHGGISGESYRDDVAGWYTPLNAFLSIGPPVGRIEEMIALLRSGVLQAVAPDVRRGPTRFTVGDVEVTSVVEARMPEVDVRRAANPLLRHLLRTAQARPFRLGSYETGGLDVTRTPSRVVDAAGRPHPRRFAFGVPTEYVHWVTAAGVRPWSASVTLVEADAIARAALS